MFDSMIRAYKQRKIAKELMFLQLEQLRAQATAEEIVIVAKRQQEDAERKKQRMLEDTERYTRWESKRLTLMQERLDGEENYTAETYAVPMQVVK